MQPINLFDYEQEALARLSTLARDYYRSGARDEVTLRRNREAFDEIEICYRVLVDVSRRSTETSVLGHTVSMPILVAPTAFHKLAHDEGEVATAQAAGHAGTVMTLSTLSNSDVEEVVNATSAPVWFQLYVYRDRGATRALVERVKEAGCTALVLTVDAPLLGVRERDVRNRFHLPQGLSVRNLHAQGYGAIPEADEGDSGLAAYFYSLVDPSLVWRDIQWLREISELPVVVKGLVRGDDARCAVEHGAAAVVVSNHGGRQLDTSPATISVLEEVVEAVDGRCEVYMDGGVRRGTDVLKALAMGARAVLVGRPVLWGLTVSGERGVANVLELLRAELDRAMALSGCSDVAAITSDLVRWRR